MRDVVHPLNHFSSARSIASMSLPPSLAIALACSLSACGGDDSIPEAQPGAVVAVTASAPTVGAKGVAVADAALARPASAPCTVTLFSNVAFKTYDPAHALPFNYAGASACPGPYAKVVLEADYSINAGRQYDRSALISIGGINLYFGTTQEPSATVAPSWHVERDVTEYANALIAAATGYVRLDNPTDATYTGVLQGTARLVFYPATSSHDAATARIADSVIPFDGDLLQGDLAALSSSTDTLQRTLSLPTNIVRAYLDVQTAPDEFWYTNVSNALAANPVFQSNGIAGGGPFREVLVTIDGQPAGVAPVVPRVYTGGIDPHLWRPTPGVETLNFIPSRIDLTPFAGALSDGNAHTIAISVEGAVPQFTILGNLLLYRDAGAATTSGAVTSNTLAAALTAPVETNGVVSPTAGSASGPYRVTATRNFVVTGYVDTSSGRVTTSVQQAVAYDNQQTFSLDSAVGMQTVDLQTGVDSTVTTQRGASTTVDTYSMHFPFTVSYAYTNATNVQVSAVTQSYTKAVSRKVGDETRFSSSWADTVKNAATTDFSSGAVVSSQASQQVTYTDSIGSCYDRQVMASATAVTAVTDALACAGKNVLNWLAQPDGAPAQGVLEAIGPD